MLRHEWVGSSRVIPRPLRNRGETPCRFVLWVRFPQAQIPPLHNPRILINSEIPNKTDNVRVTAQVFWVSTSAADWLPSSDLSAGLPAYPVKKRITSKRFVLRYQSEVTTLFALLSFINMYYLFIFVIKWSCIIQYIPN